MIKTSFITDKDINSISLEANLFYILMWMFSDDYGVTVNSNRTLLGDLYPHRESVTEKDIVIWKEELIDIGAIIECEYNDVPLLVIRKWEDHQKVPNPSKKRHIPANSLAQIIALYEDNISGNKDYLEANDGLIKVYLMKENKNKNKKRIYRKILVSKNKSTNTTLHRAEGY